ncbi:MAG: YbjQ family protein [Burkholderiaceae bacterium]
MLVSNLEIVPGRRIVAHYGMVQGSTVRAKHVGKDIFAGLKNIVGGELKSYTELMQEAREQAVERMIAEAKSMGANAILNVRFATTSIAAGAAEILAYGSAVQLDQP